MLRPARPGEKCTAFGPHLPLQEAAWRDRAVGEPARAPAPGLRLTPVATWPLPLAECSPWLPSLRPRRGPRSRRVVASRRAPSRGELRRPAPRGAPAAALGSPRSRPRQIPESPGPLPHPGGF